MFDETIKGNLVEGSEDLACASDTTMLSVLALRLFSRVGKQIQKEKWLIIEKCAD